MFGAPRGSWLQRSMFGPGQAAEQGAGRRHHGAQRSGPGLPMDGGPVFVSPMRLADDTLRLHEQRVLAVADEGLLIGLVRRESLEGAGDSPVGSSWKKPCRPRSTKPSLRPWCSSQLWPGSDPCHRPRRAPRRRFVVASGLNPGRISAGEIQDFVVGVLLARGWTGAGVSHRRRLVLERADPGRIRADPEPTPGARPIRVGRGEL